MITDDQIKLMIGSLLHDNIVLISEQEAPDDFVPVWIHSVTRTMNQNKTIAATEKLFVAKEVLEREEIVAAV